MLFDLTYAISSSGRFVSEEVVPPSKVKNRSPLKKRFDIIFTFRFKLLSRHTRITYRATLKPRTHPYPAKDNIATARAAAKSKAKSVKFKELEFVL